MSHPCVNYPVSPIFYHDIRSHRKVIIYQFNLPHLDETKPSVGSHSPNLKLVIGLTYVPLDLFALQEDL